MHVCDFIPFRPFVVTQDGCRDIPSEQVFLRKITEKSYERGVPSWSYGKAEKPIILHVLHGKGALIANAAAALLLAAHMVP